MSSTSRVPFHHGLLSFADGASSVFSKAAALFVVGGLGVVAVWVGIFIRVLVDQQVGYSITGYLLLQGYFIAVGIALLGAGSILFSHDGVAEVNIVPVIFRGLRSRIRDLSMLWFSAWVAACVSYGVGSSMLSTVPLSTHTYSSINYSDVFWLTMTVDLIFIFLVKFGLSSLYYIPGIFTFNMPHARSIELSSLLSARDGASVYGVLISIAGSIALMYFLLPAAALPIGVILMYLTTGAAMASLAQKLRLVCFPSASFT